MPSGGGGDYARWNGFYQSKNADVDGNSLVAVVPKTTTNHQIWVQRISNFDPTLGMTAAGSAGTVLGETSVGIGVLDFGPQGTPLAVGENLTIAGTGRTHIEAYEKLAVPMAIGPNN